MHIVPPHKTVDRLLGKPIGSLILCLLIAVVAIQAPGLPSSAVQAADGPPVCPIHVFASDGEYAGKIAVTWDAVPGVATYEIYRSLSPYAGSAIKIAVVDTSRYDDTAVPSGSVHYYWIKACNAKGCSDFSAPNPGSRIQGIGNIDSSWTIIRGTVQYRQKPMCALVLANGQFRSTCQASLGHYRMPVPLRPDGKVTLFCFCSEMAPYKAVWNAATTPEHPIVLRKPRAASPEISLVYRFGSTATRNWIRVSGKASYGDAPLNALILANGRHVFTSPENGEYAMQVPLDATGKVKLQAFAEGFKPWENTITP